MLQALKRDAGASRASRSALLDAPGGGAGAAPARETDSTAELDNRGLAAMQRQVMATQDTELEHLERSVGTAKHVALQINEETALHNRLLDELDVEVGATGDRLAAAQRRLKQVMRRADGCKLQLLMCMLMMVLVLVILVGFKIIVH
jgi:hypothetical protein